MIFGHAWCICILPSSCFNLQIRSSKKKQKKIQLLLIRTVQKKEEEEEEKNWSWINKVLIWELDLGALIDFVDIRGFGFTTCA